MVYSLYFGRDPFNQNSDRVLVILCSGVPAFRRSGVPAFRRSGIPAFHVLVQAGKVVHLKRWISFFGPKFPEILVEWIALFVFLSLESVSLFSECANGLSVIKLFQKKPNCK